MDHTEQTALLSTGPATGLPEGLADPAPSFEERQLWWAVGWLACLVLLLHVLLITGGRWDGDEFFNFAQYRQSGIAYLFFRTMHWSPRPISEFALYLYALAVVQGTAPLITLCLAVLWAILICGTLAAAWFGSIEGRLFRMSLALTLLASFLLGHQINEMFFWPMAAAPYLIALPAIAAATFAVIGGHTAQRSGRLAAAVALSIGVLSAETGLFFGFVFAGVVTVMELPRLTRGLRGVAGTLWGVAPLALAVCILAIDVSFRVDDATTGVGPTQVYFHRLWPSLVAALQTTPGELLLYDRSIDGLSDGVSALIQLLLLAGMYVAAARGAFGKAPWRHLIAVAVALPCTVGIIVLASFYQYGAWGFERHRSFCQCLDILLLLVVARIIAQLRPLPRHWWPIGPASLIAAMTIALAVRVPAVFHDYALIPDIREAREMTWLSGLDRSTPSMTLTLPPAGDVLTESHWQPGHYSIVPPHTDIPWYASAVLTFFGKETVNIVTYKEAEQQR